MLLFLLIFTLLQALITALSIPSDLPILQLPPINNSIPSTVPSPIANDSRPSLLSDWDPTPCIYRYDPYPYALKIYSYGRTASPTLDYLIVHDLDILVLQVLSGAMTYVAPVTVSEGLVTFTASFTKSVSDLQLARALQVVRDLMGSFGPRELRVAWFGEAGGEDWRPAARFSVEFSRI